MRTRSLALWSIPAVLTGLLLGCGSKPTASGDSKDKPGTTSAPESPPADIGQFLYSPGAYPTYEAVVARRDPLVIPNCLVQFAQRQIVSAEVDGTILLFARKFRDNKEYEDTLRDKKDLIVFHPHETEKTPLLRVDEPDEVRNGDVVAFIDTRQIDARIAGSEAILEYALTAKEFAELGAKAADDRVELIRKTAGGGQSQAELLDARLTAARFRENATNAYQTIAKTKAEIVEAKVLRGKHQVKSMVNGRIRTIYKRPGEFVKAGEKIMEIESTDRARLEGNVARAYASQLAPGMKVYVEPAVPSAPMDLHMGHRQPVTGVAVTAHTDDPNTPNVIEGPLVVSVGADGTAIVWEPDLGKNPTPIRRATHSLPHPARVAVRCVAATPPAAKEHLVITGADDGKVRIWDLTNRKALPTAPRAEPAESHPAGVQAVAISPDGRYFATAAGREVFVWELATAKRLYSLPPEHRDAVTAVSFTPQSKLVTASRDGAVRVWTLGTAGASRDGNPLDHRAGTIDSLSVTRDGGRLLFDQDKERIDLVDVATRQTVGQIQNVGTSGSFATFALFGPDEIPPGTPPEAAPYHVVTTGGSGDLRGTLQYWYVPRAGGRGSEGGRMLTPDGSPITAAAFSPVRSAPFVAVGTSSGSVLVWKPEPSGEPQPGYVTLIDATDAKYLTVRVEMDNTKLKLLDSSVANVVVPPPQKK